jgi:hypothetical protein
MRLKLQKQSELKFVSRIILHKHGYNTPQFVLGYIPVITKKDKIDVIELCCQTGTDELDHKLIK